MANADSILAEAKEAFDAHQEAWADNHAAGLDDLRFARLDEHWPADVEKQRRVEGRPCLTIPRLPPIIRQVVNDARQNKPSIKVRPADSGADPETAEVFSGLIRNIEYASSADVAYDTAVECGVTVGFGFIRIGLDYAYDDSFDLDVTIQRVSNPFSVLGDPYSRAADSSDWNTAFVIDQMSKRAFERQYKGAQAVDWAADYSGVGAPWLEGDTVQVAEYWTREQYDKAIVLLSDGSVIDRSKLEQSEELQALIGMGAVQVARERTAKCWKVRQRIMTAAEVLEDREWLGRYIPIIPVYGDEVDVEGKRHFRSLIRGAKDAQRMFNYWRTTATELVALAPRVPWTGPKGSFKTDAAKWATANRISHPYLEWDVVAGAPSGPQRQPLDVGPAAGALQEALNASDDIKAITGIYDASLGARSNETSGRAILARQREGDVSTFHFLDNMTRAIRHAGRILIDLIPQVYTPARIVRVLGEDGSERAVPLGQPVPVPGPDGKPQQGPDGLPLTRIYDLAAGKYDLTVTAGPSFTTRREEAAQQMTEMIRAFPAAAPVIGPELAKNLDWPGADKIADKLEALTPKPGGGGVPPEMQKLIQEGQKKLQEQDQELQQLKADRSIDSRKLELEAQKIALEERKVAIAEYEAQTARMVAERPPSPPAPLRAA